MNGWNLSCFQYSYYSDCVYVWCTKSIAQVGCWKNPCAHTCYCCYIANQTGCRCPMELSQFYNYGPSCSLGVIFPHTYLWYQIKDSVCLHWGEKDFNYVGNCLSGIRPHFITHVLHPMNPLFNPHPMTPSFTFKRNFHVLCAPGGGGTQWKGGYGDVRPR